MIEIQISKFYFTVGNDIRTSYQRQPFNFVWRFIVCLRFYWYHLHFFGVIVLEIKNCLDACSDYKSVCNVNEVI